VLSDTFIEGAPHEILLIDFLRIEKDLVAAAAANSAPFNAGPSRGDLDIWIRNLPENDCCDARNYTMFLMSRIVPMFQSPLDLCVLL
jgi:hypothetical protein